MYKFTQNRPASTSGSQSGHRLAQRTASAHDPRQQSPDEQHQAGAPQQEEAAPLSGLYMVTVGGIDLQSLDPETPGKTLYAYALSDNSWTAIDAPTRNYTHHHGVAVVGGKLYLVGTSVGSWAGPRDMFY